MAKVRAMMVKEGNDGEGEDNDEGNDGDGYHHEGRGTHKLSKLQSK